MASSGEEAPTEACVLWMCGDHLVRIIIQLYKLKCVSDLVSLHRTRHRTRGVDILPHSRLHPGHFKYDDIISHSLDQTELTAWAGCLADQQLEFSDKNYSVTPAGVWSRLEVTKTLM